MNFAKTPPHMDSKIFEISLEYVNFKRKKKPDFSLLVNICLLKRSLIFILHKTIRKVWGDLSSGAPFLWFSFKKQLLEGQAGLERGFSSAQHRPRA